MTIDKIRLCEDCAEALQAGGYALERIDSFLDVIPIARVSSARKRGAFAFTA